MLPFARQLELLQTIPGVGLVTAQVFIAETGGDMSRFGAPERLAAWTGLAPAVHESAGKRRPAGTRQGNKWLTSMLVEAANCAARTKNTYLAAQFKRIAGRRGHGRAAVAVAHSMLVSAYWMLERDQPYQDLGPDLLAKRSQEAHTRRLVAQLERLGHTVVLDPVASLQTVTLGPSRVDTAKLSLLVFPPSAQSHPTTAGQLVRGQGHPGSTATTTADQGQ